MSKLSAFLHPAVSEEKREVVVSNRFVDEDGRPVPFQIRALTQEQVDECSRRATKPVKGRNGVREELDPVEFSRRMVAAATEYPDFSSSELCEALGVLDPLQVPGKMLRPGEYSRLLQAITELSGFSGLEDDLKN